MFGGAGTIHPAGPRGVPLHAQPNQVIAHGARKIDVAGRQPGGNGAQSPGPRHALRVAQDSVADGVAQSRPIVLQPCELGSGAPPIGSIGCGEQPEARVDADSGRLKRGSRRSRGGA